ncbi:MAG: prepilin-type N-terminal cleavage/methylation domain-containing protein [Candidatus Acidiferrales bacterium]
MSALPQPGHRPGVNRSQRGFSLIELLVVIAIILIIAAIAIPQLLSARMAANEAAAAETVRTLTTASTTYSVTYQNGYPPAIAVLGGPSAGPANCDQAILMDPIVVAPPYQKAGFTFAYTPVGAPVIASPGCSAPGVNAYLVTAIPIDRTVTGLRSFCSDEPGTIHVDTSGTVAASQTACEALPVLQ